MEQTLTALDKTVSTLIEGATTKGAQLVDWLYQQSPEVVSQLLVWNAVESAIKFMLGGIVLCVPIVAYKVIAHFHKKLEVAGMSTSASDSFWAISIVPSAIATVASSIAAFNLINFTWLKIWIAPKVYLLEYLAQLVK